MHDSSNALVTRRFLSALLGRILLAVLRDLRVPFSKVPTGCAFIAFCAAATAAAAAAVTAASWQPPCRPPLSWQRPAGRPRP